ncbi:serine protease inhibitor Cvsi-2-like [Gigantopelta aegis]|uniref:serine protease inhibitor Cvsi-2-like n=1 Tax=Gigantopelta aegis TaxID=1735272 RepID=UPI001B88C147|nr:serine protease inhibitor Cvsi-2-like [Gigantopelta aegis]
MKVTLFLACLVAVIGIALSVSCTNNNHSQCAHIKCVPEDDYERACVDGTCTCIISRCHAAACTGSPHNCHHDAGRHGCSCHHDWHCIDGHCACGFKVIG